MMEEKKLTVLIKEQYSKVMEGLYVLVEWPDSQKWIEMAHYDSDYGIYEHGVDAFVPKDLYDKLNKTDQHLEPCFDKPHDVELYEKLGGSIRVGAYVWKKDDGSWALTEFSRCYITLQELFEHDGHRQTFVDEAEQEVQQYETHGMTDAEALDVCNNYFDGPLRVLKYDDITEDTPDGYYVNIL